MPLRIDSPNTIYEQFRGSVSGEIAGLTNFHDDSPESVLLRSESDYLYRLYHGLLAAQLSNWVNFSGGPVTPGDLEDIYAPEVAARIDLELLNSLMADFDLDQLAAANSITRDPGARATGEVIFTVQQPGTTIDAETAVGTPPDADGDYLTYETTAEVTAEGSSVTATAPIEAAERGPEYNIGSNRIDYLPDQPVGVTDVTNPNSTTGGEAPETNAELRQRAKRAMITQSGGGTVGGIGGVFIDEFDGVTEGDVEVIQYHDPPGDTAPHGEVLINAPNVSDSDLQAMFERDDIFPSCIEHTPRRAGRQLVDVELALVGTDIDAPSVETAVVNYISDLTLGDDVLDAQLVQIVMNEDANIVDTDETLVAVDEPHTYQSGTAQYTLGSQATDGGVREVTGTAGGSATTFVAGTDYQVIDSSGDGVLDTIDWSVGGSNPDDGTEYLVTYAVTDDVTIADDETADPAEITIVLQEGAG